MRHVNFTGSVEWRSGEQTRQMQSGIYCHCVIVMHMFNRVEQYYALYNIIHARTRA